MRECLRPRVAWEQHFGPVLMVKRDIKISGCRVLAGSQLVAHALGRLRDESRHRGLEWRRTLIILEQQEIVGSATLQSERAERLLLFIVSCRWPVELEVLLELGVERARRYGLEEAARRLVLDFYLLALHLFRRVLLLNEAWSGVRAGAWHR